MASQAGQNMHQSAAARPSAGLPHRRFDGASLPALVRPSLSDATPESWVEVSSQPSSSLSSVGDEIVTAGLRVVSPLHRRRRLRPSATSPLPPQQHTTAHGTGASSQEEYEEGESEEDRLLTSSMENTKLAHDEGSDADSDDGDNATALGQASDRPVYLPQPNAFSHPPWHAPRRSHSATSAVPRHPHGDFSRPSFSQRSQTRLHRNVMSPSSREDNDAALRASLTTLLSCAAAARGLPKTREEAEARRRAGNGVGPSSQPMELRLVPESELTDKAEPVQPSPPPCRGALASAEKSPTRIGRGGGDRGKRAVSAGRSPRAVKKKKTAAAAAAAVSDDGLISPTLLTWVLSAGVVVLLSVGFGAGYVMGRGVGRHETLSAGVSSVNETTRCGSQVMGSSGGGFRRLRQGAVGVGKSIIAQA